MQVIMVRTPTAAETLKDVIDAWCAGFEEATKDVENDRSLDEPEDMLEAMDGMKRQYADLQDIRGQLG
jgi:predicted transcriptional regulator of viral defense system